MKLANNRNSFKKQCTETALKPHCIAENRDLCTNTSNSNGNASLQKLACTPGTGTRVTIAELQNFLSFVRPGT